MTTQSDCVPNATTSTRRKSSILAALTLNCNLPTIPIINEPSALSASTAPATATTLSTISASGCDAKKKSLRFDTNTMTSEYDSEEVKETKRRITDEIKRWVTLECLCECWMLRLECLGMIGSSSGDWNMLDGWMKIFRWISIGKFSRNVLENPQSEVDINYLYIKLKFLKKFRKFSLNFPNFPEYPFRNGKLSREKLEEFPMYKHKHTSSLHVAWCVRAARVSYSCMCARNTKKVLSISWHLSKIQKKKNFLPTRCVFFFFSQSVKQFHS